MITIYLQKEHETVLLHVYSIFHCQINGNNKIMFPLSLLGFIKYLSGDVSQFPWIYTALT